MLDNQDAIALKMIFRGSDKISSEIRKRIATALCTNREETGVGFYSTIRIDPPLSEVPDLRMFEYNFRHPDFPDGGSYMCNIVSQSELEIEAVTLGGANWPNPSDVSLFEEL